MPRRPSAKQLAKAQERFKTALTDYIISKGARPGRFYDHELDTPAGLLHVSVYGDWIATRFDDVEAGRRFTKIVVVGCNQYSGKWNFHFSTESVASLDPDAAIAHFGYYLDRLLNWQPDAE